MGREAHAVDEYVTAAKLLAREGLPLEAIAACKAVLELEPKHTETQLFLARLYARVPDAGSVTSRVARPLETEQSGLRRKLSESSSLESGSDTAKARSQDDSAEPITLSRPKGGEESRPEPDSLLDYGPDEETAVREHVPREVLEGPPPDATSSREVSGPKAVLDQTRQAEPGDLPNLDEMRIPEEREETQPLGAVDRGEPDADPDSDTEPLPGDEIPDDLVDPNTDDRSTVEMAASDRQSVLQQAVSGESQGEDHTDLRTTIDVDEGDIVESEAADPPASVHQERTRQATPPLGREFEASRQSRDPTAHGLPSVGDEPDTAELEGPEGGAWEETFEVGVFDMESLRLDRESTGDWDDLSFLDELEEPDTDEFGGVGSAGEARRSSMMSVSRSELPDIPLFSQLEPELFMRLLRVIDLGHVGQGKPVVGPQHPSQSLYVIVRGRATVTRRLDDGTVVELAELGEGEFFGEFGLLTGRNQMATVRASTDVSLLEVRREVIDRVAEKHPEIWDVLWQFYYARMLNNLLASSNIFRSLDMTERRRLAQKFELHKVEAGQLLLGEGDHDHDLYLICHGQIRVEREVSGGGPSREIDTLREGEFVGLISSVEEEPVVANLRATSDVTVLALAGAEFRRVIDRHPQVEREVRRTVRERKDIAGQYTSGVTSYAELGLAPPPDSTTD